MNVNLNNVTFNNIKGETNDAKNIVNANAPKSSEEAREVMNTQLNVSRAEMQSDAIEAILSSAGFKLSDENKALVDMLLNDGKPVTKENLVMLNRFVKLVGTENADKATFFMNNDLKPTISNGENLVEMAEHSFQIGEEAAVLAENLKNVFDDTVLRNELVSRFGDSLPKESVLHNGGFEKAVAQLNEALDNEISNIKEKEPMRGTENLMGKNAEDIGIGIKSSAVNSADVNSTEDVVNNNKINFKNNGFENINNNVNEENLTQVKKFVSENKEQILTMLKESIQKGDIGEFAKAVSTLKNYDFSKKGTEYKIIDELFKENPLLKEKINSVLNVKEEFTQMVHKRLNFNIKEKTPEELENFVKEYGNTVKEIKENIQKTNSEKYDNIIKMAENIINKTEFMSELKETAMLQIPVVINNKVETAEIYIFKNKKNKNKKNGGAVSAVISLDTGYIGHFEAYVVKENRAVNCQFRVSENTKKIIKENIALLDRYLKDYNLELKGYSFKEISEKFSIVKKEPVYEESSLNLSKNFVFDTLT